jgi:hypothetical protein
VAKPLMFPFKVMLRLPEDFSLRITAALRDGESVATFCRLATERELERRERAMEKHKPARRANA